LAAIYGRSTLGGSEIDLCQVECLFQLNADAILADQIEGLARQGSRRPGEAPVCVVPAGGEEEAWLMVAIDGDDAWRALCAVLGEPALSAAWSLAERQARAGEIEAAIARWAAARSADVAAEALQAAGIAAAPVLPTHGLWRNEQLAQGGYWAIQQRRFIGEHMTPQSPIRLDGTRPRVTWPAPTLGEHTDEVLAELGAIAAE
jgi:benzylsuccinate CoA-transferase BbsF subunit